MAKCIIENRNRDFWHEIRKIKGSSKIVSSVVDGLTESSGIANFLLTNMTITDLRWIL